jgi:hypothetical protein
VEGTVFFFRERVRPFEAAETSTAYILLLIMIDSVTVEFLEGCFWCIKGNVSE